MFTRRRRIALLAAGSAAVLAGGIVTATQAQAAVGCEVTYTVSSSWPGGFGGNVSVHNVGDALNGWTLTWSFSAGQTVTQAWNATVAQSGSAVTATNVDYNRSVASGATFSFGFNGSWTSSNPVPTSFALNGVTCNGTVAPTSLAPSTRAPGTSNDVPQTSRPPVTSAAPTTRPPVTSAGPTGSTGGNGLVGWATQGGGTTGGAGGSSTTVTSLSALTTAAKASGSAVIFVNGNFSCSADVVVAANKSIIGVGSGSGLTGCGLNIKVNNVIVKNMKIARVPASNGNGDAIHIDGGTHIWLDHNDLSSDTSHGTDYYDGLLDATHASDYITVSWNILHDHIKCSLVGHSDSNASEDTGHLRITYHHNEFKNCAQRGPRVRFSPLVHVYNNYYVNTQGFDYSYSIATTDGAGVLVEGNYFENISDPTHLSEGSSAAGRLVARNNYTTGSGSILTSGSVSNPPYGYSVDTASNVKSIVTSGAGTGKVSS